MKEPSGLGPILIGYGFLLLGIMIAVYASRKGPIRPGVQPASPMLGMFVSGLWVGLVLGGLGLIFYASTLTGFVTVGVILGARLLATRASRPGRGEGS